MRNPSRRIGKKCISNDSEENVGGEFEDRNAWTGEKVPQVEQSVFRKEMNECIRGFITKLPENYRTILVLSEFEGFKNEEIEAIKETYRLYYSTGIAPSAAKEIINEKFGSQPYCKDILDFMGKSERGIIRK